MKTFLIFSCLFLFVSLNNKITLSQFGWQKIYSDDTALGIYSFNSFNLNNQPKKQIYIIRGINFNPYGNPNNSGKTLKLNRINNTWFQPANGFLNANWCLCTCPFTCNPPSLVCLAVLRYVVSPSDTQVILKNVMGSCGCEAGDNNYITTNGGVTSINLAQFSNGLVGQLCFGFDIDPVDDQVIYLGYPILGTSYKCVYKSTNMGSTWIATDTNTNFSQGLIKINPLKRTNIFTCSFSSLMLSTNSGTDFFAVGGPPLSKMSFNYSDSVIFGLGTSGIYKSTNHGFNWILVLNGQYRTIEVSPDNKNIVYAGSNAGLHRSTNGGQNWSLYNDSFNPSKTVIGISKDAASGDTVYVATLDAVYKVFSGWLGINNISSEIPEKFELYQNYPNPFNPSTKIIFSLPKSSLAALVIYDALGKELEILVNEQLSAGTYEVNWNASGYPSGVYFYALSSGNFNQVNKMIFLK